MIQDDQTRRVTDQVGSPHTISATTLNQIKDPYKSLPYGLAKENGQSPISHSLPKNHSLDFSARFTSWVLSHLSQQGPWASDLCNTGNTSLT